MPEFQMFPDSDPVTLGTGFLSEPGVAALLSPERRILIAREDSKERREVEAKEAERQEAAEARAWRLEHDGAGREHGQVLADAATAFDRQDRREARVDRQALEDAGEPIPEHLDISPMALAKAQREREAAAAVTPASVADLKKLEQSITKLKAKDSTSKTDIGTLKYVLGRLLGRG